MVDWNQLPGISKGGGRRNYAIGAVYVILVLAVIGTLTGAGDDDTGDADEEMTPTQTEALEATATQTPVATDGGTPATTSAPTATQAATATASPEPTPAQPSTLGSIRDVDGYYDSGSTSLSGSGQTVTDTFEHPGGLLVADFEHDGESNFIVEVYSEESGEQEELLVNEIGEIEGATGVPLPAGEYSFDVDADGAWSIDIANPIAPEGEIQEPPASASGDGKDVVGPIELDGTVTVTGSHEGDENFIVNLHNEAEGGQFSGTLVFNEIGEVDDAETRVSHSGIAWVVVDANGAWELEFE